MTPGFIAPAMPNGTCTHASASIAFGWSRFPCVRFSRGRRENPVGQKVQRVRAWLFLSLWHAYACSK